MTIAEAFRCMRLTRHQEGIIWDEHGNEIDVMAYCLLAEHMNSVIRGLAVYFHHGHPYLGGYESQDENNV